MMHWTPIDLSRLRNLLGFNSVEETAKKLHRPVEDVKTKMKELGLLP